MSYLNVHAMSEENRDSTVEIGQSPPGFALPQATYTPPLPVPLPPPPPVISTPGTGYSDGYAVGYANGYFAGYNQMAGMFMNTSPPPSYFNHNGPRPPRRYNNRGRPYRAFNYPRNSNRVYQSESGQKFVLNPDTVVPNATTLTPAPSTDQDSPKP